MRTKWALCAAALLCLSAAVATAQTPGNAALVAEKDSQPTGEPTYEGRVEGETIETAFEIEYFPFTDSMDTCPFLHDYDECCPYTGSMSPDVVYRYDCLYDRSIDIDLCASSYDTKVFVYENAHGNLVGCNDDMLGCGPMGYQSWLSVELVAGNTYYIVIDGYGSDCGTYELDIQDHVPCVYCPPGAIVETEPECMDPTNDVHNGGCNSDPPVFHVIQPSEDIIDLCGTSGTYYQSGSNWRDTDWYQIDLAQTSEITFQCIPNFNMTMGFVDGREGCEGVSGFYSYTTTLACYVATLTEVLPAGTWWLWVGPTEFTGVECGELYAGQLTGYNIPVTPVENISWSTLKALHR